MFKLYDGLTFRSQFNFERGNSTFKAFIPIYYSIFLKICWVTAESKYNEETMLTHNNYQIFNYIAEQRLNYLKNFGLHRIDAMMGLTYEEDNYETLNGFKTTALGNDENYRVLNAQTKGDQTSGTKTVTSILSYFLRFNYSYADKYLLTTTFRADGSSRFAKSNRWGYFPAFSLGWRISEEDFFKNAGVENWLSSLKLRVGWGQNGNQRIASTAPLTLIGTDISKQWWFGNDFSQGYVPTYAGNKDVKWETSEQTNIGLDISLFGNALNIISVSM